MLYGGDNQDSLEGGFGNDSLLGDSGNDWLDGGADNDYLLGTNSNLQGHGEIDTLMGGEGSDQFVLGDNLGGYYNAQSWNDYVRVSDFDLSQDIIQLHDQSGNYWLGSWSGNTYLYENTQSGWDGVAIIEDVNLNSSHLSTSAFVYL